MSGGGAVAKRRKRNDFDSTSRSSPSPFSILDDDSLRAVLLRTRADDHPNLRLSCKRIRSILDSVDYRKERSELGCAEVKMELLDPFEQYKIEQEVLYYHEQNPPPSRNDDEFLEEYDRLGRKIGAGSNLFWTGSFRVFVDGWPLHKKQPKKKEHNDNFGLNLHLLPRECPFHNFFNHHSSVVDSMCTLLFNNHGDPSVKCIKNAMPKTENSRLHILYIANFTLPLEYRSTASTVGPLILQELLKVFHDEYSIAIYEPTGTAQYNPNDAEAREHERQRDRHRNLFAEPTSEEILANQKKDKYFKALTHQDMRQFFRAGFRQVTDPVVWRDNPNYDFVFVTRQGTRESIMTEQQALDLPIAGPPPPPKPKKGITKELFDSVLKGCCTYREIVQHPTRRETDELDEFTAVASDEIRSILSRCETNRDRLGAILDSDAIHVCAANENLTFINLLLSLLPNPSRETTLALNHLDDQGYTPLMIVAKRISNKSMDPKDTTESRQFLESIIGLGAVTSTVHAITGLSALGCFRQGWMQIRNDLAAIGLNRPQVAIQIAEADRIEQILRPYEGPTEADEAILTMEEDEDDDDIDDDWEEDY